MSDMGNVQQSAYDIITSMLSTYGLQNLGGFVNDIVFKEDVTDPDIIRGRIRQTPEYRQRFAGNEARRQAGYNVLSENEYIYLENAYRQMLRASGMPTGFYDSNEDFNTLIGGDVSVAELAQRVNQGYEAVANADPQVVNEMKRLYGVNDNQLAAYFLDPAKATPILVQQAKAAQISAEATLQGGFDLSASQAEQLARSGVDVQAARQGFQQIGAMQEVFNPLQGEQAISRETQVAGIFGTDAEAQRAVRERIRSRTAAFETGGAFATQGTVVTGLQ